MEDSQFLERKLLIGLISNTEFIKAVHPFIDSKLIESETARRISIWCISHYVKHNKAIGKDLEIEYYERLKKGLPKDIAEDIEQNILPGLSDEFEEDGVDLTVLIEQTQTYFDKRRLILVRDQITDLLDRGDITAATNLVTGFKPVLQEKEDNVTCETEDSLNEVDYAFLDSGTPLIRFPKALGEFWNKQFIRGGFVALLASEKRGKSWMLLDIGYRAVIQGNQVAFFQAGDMSKSAQIRRLCIHIAKTSDDEKYCGKMYEAVPDCVRNQLNLCDNENRECGFGIFTDTAYTEKDIKFNITFEELKEAYKNNPDYKTCYNCKDYKNLRLGVPWLKEVNVKTPLTVLHAKKLWYEHFIKRKRKLKISTYANGTLSVSKIKILLDKWEKKDGFVPDVIIIDYADLLVPDTKQEFRHQQNEIWKNLRNLSQEERGGIMPLVITATQADAKSYTAYKLTMSNFSEDHRKNAHPTAIFSLDQDAKGREKQIGILRIGTIVLREGDFNPVDYVTVCQNLKRGQPVTGSYF